MKTIKVRGVITSDKSGVKIKFSRDLVELLNWFLLKETGMIFHTPFYGSKISLYNPKQHTYKPHYNTLQKYVGKRVWVHIDVSKAIHLQSKKGYWVHWVNVEDKNVWSVINHLGLSKNFTKRQRPHMSISNGKYFVKRNVDNSKKIGKTTSDKTNKDMKLTKNIHLTKRGIGVQVSSQERADELNNFVREVVMKTFIILTVIAMLTLTTLLVISLFGRYA